MLIRTERLILRDFTAGDASDLHEILGDAETMRYCEPAYDLAKTQAFLEDFCIAKKGAVAAALGGSHKVIGYLLFKPLEASVYEIGWIFHRAYWRQGYAYEACCALLAHGFHELGVHKVVAETVDPQKSVALMEKLGMRREGVQRRQTRDPQGNWADLYLYGLLHSDVL